MFARCVLINGNMHVAYLFHGILYFEDAMLSYYFFLNKIIKSWASFCIVRNVQMIEVP